MARAVSNEAEVEQATKRRCATQGTVILTPLYAVCVACPCKRTVPDRRNLSPVLP